MHLFLFVASRPLRPIVVAIARGVGVSAFVLLAPLSCASLARPVLVRQPDAPTTSAIEARSIHILWPLLFYEDVQTQHEEQPDPGEFDRVRRKIVQEIEAAAASKGFTFSGDQDLEGAQQAAVELGMETLRRDVMTVFKARKRTELFEEALGSLGDSLDAELVIASFLRVKVGRGGYWDPYSGGIYPGTSTSQLLLAIIDLSDRQVVWTSEVFARRGPDRALLGKMLEMALSSLPESGRGGT